jgi:glucokinase
VGKRAIGIDLGGTDIKAGVVDDQGKILCKISIPTQVAEGRTAIIRNVASAANLARRKGGFAWRQISAIGLGAPGVVEYPSGIVRHNPNLQCLLGQELLQPVMDELDVVGMSMTLDNDANMAAYAEAWIGVGKGRDTLALMTLGTGIGGGLILNGDIWRGAWGAGAELGHHVLFPDGVKCGCGSHGCLEMYGSATALVRRFLETVASGKRSPLATRARKGAEVGARDIDKAAKSGDKLCRNLIEETGRFLGIGAANMFNILNVEMVVFAGGMTASGKMLLDAIRAEAKKRTIPVAMKGAKILFSKLGNDAGLIGAAGYALKQARARKRN